MARYLFDDNNEGAGMGEPDAPLTPEELAIERDWFEGTGGESSVCCDHGLVPGFSDEETGCVYRALYRDGSPAPMHVLDGLPDEVVLDRDADGHVMAVKSSLVSGFIFNGCFYTREEAAALIAA
ncbi:hypothetical protein [Aquisalimonas sp.]|uniref:hypothetical protein n=1 Tax=Aquisalimonas sp. TaxID=1872621 RepID=UPI0025BB76A1|nr:hypothetical protein [Aquisalimonas sp.]